MNKEQLMRCFGKKVKVNSNHVNGVYFLTEYHLILKGDRLIKSVTVSDGIRTTYQVPIESVDEINGE